MKHLVGNDAQISLLSKWLREKTMCKSEIQNVMHHPRAPCLRPLQCVGEPRLGTAMAAAPAWPNDEA